MPYIQIHKKTLVVILIVIAALVALHVYVAAHAIIQYQTCTQLEAAGHSNIPAGNAFYRAELDRDHNKIACQT